MSTHKSTLAFLKLSLAVVLISLWAVSPAGAAPLTTLGTDTSGNAIVVHAQDTNSGQVVVDSVSATQDGWLLIHSDSDGAPGRVIGFAPVHQGMNTNVVVDIETVVANGKEYVTPTLWATLVADPNAVYPLASPDATVEQEGSLATATFSSTAAGGAAQAIASASQVPTTGGITGSPSAATASKITVRAQDTNSGQVVVDSVSATQDGWLLIRNDVNGAPNKVIGFAPVHPGMNANVVVDIQLFLSNGKEAVTPMLWATLVADPNAALPFALPDATVQQEGSLATVAFSSTAAGGAAQ